MTDEEAIEAAVRDLRLHGVSLTKVWIEDGVVKREAISPDDYFVEPARPKPSSDRMAVGE